MSHYMSFTCLLHTFYIHSTCLLHAFYMPSAFLLHVFCIPSACLPHAFRMPSACHPHAFCMPSAYLLMPSACLLHAFCMPSTCLLHFSVFINTGQPALSSPYPGRHIPTSIPIAFKFYIELRFFIFLVGEEEQAAASVQSQAHNYSKPSSAKLRDERSTISVENSQDTPLDLTTAIVPVSVNEIDDTTEDMRQSANWMNFIS